MPILTISRAGVVEQQVSLDKETLRIGRLEDNDVVLRDGSISRHHAQIERHGDQYLIKDLGSQNGIWSRGVRVNQLDLHPGVPFVMGVFSATLEVGAAPQAGRQASADSYGAVSSSSAMLFVVEGPSLQQEFPLNRPQVLLGRSSTVEIPIDHEMVSKHHAKISFQNNQHVITDTGSRNGVFVNGLRVETHVLQHRDEIQIGPARFVYSETGERVVSPPASAAAPAYGVAPPPSPDYVPSAALGYVPPLPPPKEKKSLFAKIPKPVLIGGALAIVIIIVLVAVLSGPPKTEGPSARETQTENQQIIQKLLLEGKQYFANGDYQGALEKANAVLTPDLDPNNREALDLQTKAQDKLRELAAARAKAEEEAAAKAAKIQALLMDANNASKNGDFETSKTKLEEAHVLDPDNPNVKKALVETFIGMAKVAAKKRDFKGAFEAYDAALQIDSTSAEATKGRESLASYEQAAKAREARTRALFEEARKLAASGDLGKAYQNLNSVLSMNPNYPQASALRSQIQAQLEAKVKPLYDEGVRLFNAGQIAEAAKKFSQALAIYPDHGPTQQFMNQARNKMRAEAQEAYKRGYINEGLGRYKEALDFYQKTLNLLPDSNEEYHRKAAEKIAQLKDKVR